MELSVLQYVLPASLLEYFVIIDVSEQRNESTKELELHIFLEEKNAVPSGYNQDDYELKDYQCGKPLQDFPIRGKAVFLYIKRRRWRNKKNHRETISNDYSFLSGGNKLTKELSDFLKDTGRDAK